MKMYILLLDELNSGKAALMAAHASLAGYLKFKDTPEVEEWLSGPFKKVICSVNQKEFDKAKTFEDCLVLTESSLDNQEVAIVFKPRNEWPKPFKFYKMFIGGKILDPNSKEAADEFEKQTRRFIANLDSEKANEFLGKIFN